MSKISFIGDVMLGRFVAAKYVETGYNPVDTELQDEIRKADVVIANLESAVKPEGREEKDHLSFLAPDELVGKFKWVDCFSTANNHINDGGTEGITASLNSLKKHGIASNGIYTENYEPYIIEKDGNKIAVVTLTDMMNTEIAEDCGYSVLRLGDEKVKEVIHNCKKNGCFVILFAHVGMLFTRFPNPITYNYLHDYCDDGCDAIVTAHSHCVGGWETYKGKPIFHSLGDFVMDGNSFRRRRSSWVTLEIENNKLVKKSVGFAEIDKELVTRIATNEVAEKLSKSIDFVEKKITKHKHDYEKFYKSQYKKEIVQHSLSTLQYLIKSKGVVGLLRLLAVRSGETLRMMKWASSDRSKVQRDDDALTDRIDTSKM